MAFQISSSLSPLRKVSEKFSSYEFGIKINERCLVSILNSLLYVYFSFRCFLCVNDFYLSMNNEFPCIRSIHIYKSCNFHVGLVHACIGTFKLTNTKHCGQNTIACFIVHPLPNNSSLK